MMRVDEWTGKHGVRVEHWIGDGFAYYVVLHGESIVAKKAKLAGAQKLAERLDSDVGRTPCPDWSQRTRNVDRRRRVAS